MLSLYHPGSTLLHRLPAGAKLAGLLVIGLAAAATDRLLPLAVLAGAGMAVLIATRAPGETIRRQLAGLAVVVGLVVVANLVFADLTQGLAFALRVVILVTFAAAITITTRTDDILGLIESGLARFGRRGRIAAERLGLAIALVIRFVPELFAEAAALREAMAARGLRASPARLLVPMLVRTLRTADAVSDAIEARGYPGQD